MKVLRWPALRTGHLYSPGNVGGTHSVTVWVDPRTIVRSEELSECKIRMNRTRDLPAFSAVPQPSSPPLTDCSAVFCLKIINLKFYIFHLSLFHFVVYSHNSQPCLSWKNIHFVRLPQTVYQESLISADSRVLWYGKLTGAIPLLCPDIPKSRY